MKVLVTGASGHVGGNLTTALLSKGYDVRCLVRKDRRSIEGLEVEKFEGDILDPESLSRAVDGVDVVYHTAGYISLSHREWPVLESINVEGTRNVVNACIDRGVKRLVHFSSIHVFQQRPFDIPVDESRAMIDVSTKIYDSSKVLSEMEVIQGIGMGLDAVIINPTAILGPNDYKLSHMGKVLIKLGCGKLPALIHGGYDYVDVRDVVAGAIKAGETAKTGSKYILSGHWISVRELAGIAEDITGVRAPGFVFPMWVARLGLPFASAYSMATGKSVQFTKISLDTLCSNKNMSHKLASLDLGYNPRPIRETLSDAFGWYAKNGFMR
jgi:dihydroflavonol-4-reductase